MARFSLLSQPGLTQLSVADSHGAELLGRVAATLSARPELQLVLDPRWAALSSSTLQRLLDEGPGARMRAGDGTLVGAVVENALPDTVETWEQAGVEADGPGEAFTVPASEDHALRGPIDVDAVERAWMGARLAALARSGVRVIRPERIWIGAGVEVAAGAVLWPDIVLRGATVLADGVEIQPGCWIEDSEIGPGSLIKAHSVIGGARIGPRCTVGPMAHLRQGAVLERDVKIGNFVEVKKALLREGAKASHLTYLGDAEIGAQANIGAGTITCNYDGYGKNKTSIGRGAFIGSNTALVAPVSVGDGAIVGAGSVISQDVPAEALAFERAPTTLLEGRAPRLRQKNQARAERAKRGSDG